MATEILSPGLFREATYAVTPVGNIPALTNIPKSEILGLDADAHAQPPVTGGKNAISSPSRTAVRGSAIS